MPSEAIEENQETQQAEAAPEVVQDTKEDIQFPSGRVFETLQGVHTKGKAKGNIRIILNLDLSRPDPFSDLKAEVGVENWNREIMALIREKCNDATHDAVAESTDGIPEDTVWARKFLEQWVSSTRRSGVGVKQLREKLGELFQELNPLLMKQAKAPKEMTAEETNRLLTLLADYGDLNEKIEARSRKGKAKK